MPAFASIRPGGDIEQALIGLRILDDGGGPAFDRQHHGPFALFELFHEFARTAAKSGQRWISLVRLIMGLSLFKE